MTPEVSDAARINALVELKHNQHALKAAFDTLTQEERKNFINLLLDGCCKHCLRLDERCRCWDDE